MNNANYWRAVPLAHIMIATTLIAVGTPKAKALDQRVETQIEAIRQATARFEDVNVALAEGYIPDPSGHCVDRQSRPRTSM